MAGADDPHLWSWRLHGGDASGARPLWAVSVGGMLRATHAFRAVCLDSDVIGFKVRRRHSHLKSLKPPSCLMHFSWIVFLPIAQVKGKQVYGYFVDSF